ncbi:hypothetical protein [Actinoplanes aureus]|uniref:Uncharacterized protein n=1 Tax=Actinoplanes aureus TaxID=2792083 RepID=A0A931CH52_9ACTN|nr:hypothetical protein [Actinoplanes aureus]MBG0567173.1 hypothetical protein [Actinoplanes aureus]
MERIPRILTATMAVGILGLGGCSSTPAEGSTQAVCDSFAAVQNTVNQIKNANVSENGLNAARPYVSQLLNELNQLVQDAKAQFKPQADMLKTTVDQLQASVDTARTDPNRTNLSAVRASVAAVRESAENLRDAVSGFC